MPPLTMPGAGYRRETRCARRKPYHSLNFVIAHDGFTLADLCTYDAKHNDANGEQNRDGSNDNFSWNCGAEGATEDGAVLALRQRQMRNLMLALLVAQGTPMVLSGRAGSSAMVLCHVQQWLLLYLVIPHFLTRLSLHAWLISDWTGCGEEVCMLISECMDA